MFVVFLMPVPVAVPCLLYHVVELPQCSGIKALPVVYLLVCVGSHAGCFQDHCSATM